MIYINKLKSNTINYRDLINDVVHLKPSIKLSEFFGFLSYEVIHFYRILDMNNQGYFLLILNIMNNVVMTKILISK